MNISSGLSEINFNSVNRQEKIYVWPKYKEKPVEPIKRITGYTENNGFYSKPTDTQKELILKNLYSEKNAVYSADRNLNFNTSGSIRPGTFFDALV
ncbi:MAG: hypothetical protein JW982_09850 [Spirochaetes bacterium]|nr:hypothetical protein [Spirochaetota bacterium]